MTIRRLNLKEASDRLFLEQYLEQADLLITATRPAALERLGLSWHELTTRYPRLCQVAIVGFSPPQHETPGHDLTYQARLGLLQPPHLPRTVLADLAGAQEVVTAACGLLLARERGQGCHLAQVSLAEAADYFAEPVRHGLTTPEGILGGAFPGYNLYRARDGWVAVAALEPHFWRKLAGDLNLIDPDQPRLQEIFLTASAQEWETWGAAHDLPIAAVRSIPSNEESQR
jgi:crotonobetainyl-CoA:carnitine CoA-transferase CaiB-like acyl-CoA transferase